MANLNAKILIDEEGQEFVPLSYVQAIFSSDGSKNLENLLAECVKSINGNTPDENGNIEIEAGGGTQTIGGTEDAPIDLRTIVDPGVYFLDGYFTYGPGGSGSSYLTQSVLFIITGKSSETGNYNLIQVIIYMASAYITNPSMGYRYKLNTAAVFPNNFTTIPLTNTENITLNLGTNYNLAQSAGFALNEKMGALDNLATTDKTTLVAAINEVASGSGGSGGGGSAIPILAGTTESPIDLNEITTAGIYLVDTTYGTVLNLPTGANAYKKVLLFVEGLYGEYGPGFYNAIVKQTIFIYIGSQTNYVYDTIQLMNRVYVNRSATSSSWTSWTGYNMFSINADHKEDVLNNVTRQNSSVAASALNEIIYYYVTKNARDAVAVQNDTLDNLATTDKTSLVAAINELNARLAVLEGGTTE